MKEWIERQIEQGDVIALEKVEKEINRVNSLINYYNGLICNSLSECIPRYHSALVYENEFKQKLEQAKKEIVKEIAGTLFNKVI